MNTITQTNVNYLRPNRTMETLLLEKKGISKTVFVYNYESVHFRVFENQKEVSRFINGDPNTKTITEFIDENELDSYLQKVVL